MLTDLTKQQIRELMDPVTDAGSITVGITAVKIFDYNTQRRLAAITNNSINDIYLGFGSTLSINQGIRINAYGGAFEFGLYTNFPWLGEIWAIAAIAGNSLTFVEV